MAMLRSQIIRRLRNAEEPFRLWSHLRDVTDEAVRDVAEEAERCARHPLHIAAQLGHTWAIKEMLRTLRGQQAEKNDTSAGTGKKGVVRANTVDEARCPYSCFATPDFIASTTNVPWPEKC